MNSVNNIPTGLVVPAQVPLDAKLFSPDQATLANLGTSNNLAYTYHDSMEVFCMTEKTRWIWREVQLVEPTPGLVASDFTYPNGLIVFGIDYSNKVYNFFPVLPPPVYDELNDLTDVTIGTLANNDLLAYNLSTSQWENQTYAALGIQPTLTQPVTGHGTTNKVPKYSSTPGELVDSNITDTGSLVTIASPTNIVGATNITGATTVVGTTNVTGVTTIKSPSASPTVAAFTLLDSASGTDPFEIRPSQAGKRNTFIGRNAGKTSTTTAENNTVVGSLAAALLTTGRENTFMGYVTGAAITTQVYNTFIGSGSGYNAVSSYNTFLGAISGYSNNTGQKNVFLGYLAGNKNQIGSQNTFVGTGAGSNNGDTGVSGSFNTAVGDGAGYNTKTGDRNVYLGQDAGASLNDTITAVIEADQSIFIGAKTTANSNSQSNQIVIGHAAAGLGSNTTVIGNSSTTLTGLFGNLRLMSGMGTAPATSTSTGVTGTIIVDASYIYACIATNTWKRTAITTW